MPFGYIHNVLRAFAFEVVDCFFDRVLFVGSENIPEGDVPLVVVANHWNCAADVYMLSCFFPKLRRLHYWAKSAIFVPGIIGNTLLKAGNIPVDRRNKDNQSLFALTIDSLKQGEAVVVFPEGGSLTVPGLTTIKDGASWATLEYLSNLDSKGNALSTGIELAHSPKPLVLLISGITYTDKTRYRSSAVIEYGAPIDLRPYYTEFKADQKVAVKNLSATILSRLKGLTANASDFDTLHAAHMAENIIWPDDRLVDLKHLTPVRQALIDAFQGNRDSKAMNKAKECLVRYYHSLKAHGLTHFSLLPLPVSLDLNFIDYDESGTETSDSILTASTTSKIDSRSSLTSLEEKDSFAERSSATSSSRAPKTRPVPPSPPLSPADHQVIQTALLYSAIKLAIYVVIFALPLALHVPLYLTGATLLIKPDTLEEDVAQNKIIGALVAAFVSWSLFIALSTGLLVRYYSFSLLLSWVISVVSVFLLWRLHNVIINPIYFEFRKASALWSLYSHPSDVSELLKLRQAATSSVYALYQAGSLPGVEASRAAPFAYLNTDSSSKKTF